MRSITCQGTPSEIGLQHGQQAKSEIQGSIEFYNDLFKKKCSMDWQGVCRTAAKFIPLLEASFPEYLQEIKGIAQGADVDMETILALNVRTELAYGMFSDGCTAFSWKSKTESFLGQNWDWDKAQSPNLVSMHIRPSQPSKPSIHMITEAGIIGKIGLNSCGVGVTLNAIKCAGVDFNKIPCHLALRTVLNSSSRAEAVEKLEKLGVASACHILVADHTGGTGLECSAYDIVRLNMGDEGEPCPGVITHSNHFVREHNNVNPILYLADSEPRLRRVRELTGAAGSRPGFDAMNRILEDEKGYPTGICRAPTENSQMASLFSIIMDLKGKTAAVKIGRPVSPTGSLELRP
ncbi:acyl-coenzyme A:Isopenicillin N acyltransferase [Coccidioides immitis RS]|uniref:Acyl-coenzyme A:Isopenicillin N acyltransferase n=3 Tax=Coccidioides immitis TaxID=5501 RepID=J3K605_COCIM|nr:acyl-coenzyme A:Isopenicillin N acyltransferase [Coccidioides immitis RS]EAS29932.3 acyl-coenzyme A:Isopenicillin N acyltransferase [Coccidioides immitis RS]KMP06915.1 acyl-CoA [Coccidioides immitis RMSCC 2394]KMU91988.1 hypothetical protein CIHG_09759 [Coccidioides immitis H538.4]